MMRHLQNRGVLPNLLLSCALAGCSIVSMGPMNKDVDQTVAGSDLALSAVRQGVKLAQAPLVPAVEKTEASYLPVRKISARKSDKGDNDPALRREIAINRTFVSPQDFAERLTALTGIPVNIEPDVMSAPGATAPVSGMPIGEMPAIRGGALAEVPGANGFPLNLTYSGPVAGLMDVACTRMGISWQIRDSQIKLFRYMSKTFRLSALPGDTSMMASINNASTSAGSSGSGGSGGSGGSSGSSGGGGGVTSSKQTSTSSQTAGVTFAGLSVWKGIEDSIKAMLTQRGKVIVVPSLGTVTVTDSPTVVDEIERFIATQNAALSQQVVVNVRVLLVQLDRSENYGINWDAVYTALSKNIDTVFKSNVPSIAGAGSITTTVMQTAGQATNSSIQAWRGSKAIVEALSTQGRVATLTSASITTLNNQPAPIQVGRQTSYLASSATTTSINGNTTALIPGTVSTGFAMTIVPHVIDSKNMFLQYAIDISDLVGIASFASGGAMIQSPTIDSRTSIQRVMVSSGDTIVVTGFEASQNSVDSQGVLDAEMPAAGGSVKGSRKKVTLVILIQPVLLANP